jgi:molybdopterin/thiamine biosynthesis adenylyltransferase
MPFEPPAARGIAESELSRQGFSLDATTGFWSIPLDPSCGIGLRVAITEDFPFELPIISVDRTTLPRPIPHVERSGKICIAPATGLLIDASRPEAVLQEVLQKAREIVVAGLNSANSEDFLSELDAYWSPPIPELISFCGPSGDPRVVVLARAFKGPWGSQTVIAETAGDLRELGRRFKISFATHEKAYLVPLTSSFAAPGFEEESRLDFARRVTSAHLLSASREAFGRLPVLTDSRLVFLFSVPADSSGNRALVGLRSEKVLPPTPGFRPGKAPLSVVLQCQGDQRCERVKVQRADQAFLNRRTGSDFDLSTKRVLVVGCGAIGGHLAMCLASSGVGRLTLVDKDVLRAENTMRHLLGMGFLGHQKALALKEHLEGRLPHIAVDARVEPIEKIVAKEPAFASSYDVIAMATGDHTLELRLSRGLRRFTQIVHGWLEAYGVGGHVLLDGRNERGCLGCLFREDESHGLVCRASLFAPGQKFVDSIGGCAGTFTSFGSLDAQRAAIETTKVILRALTGKLTKSTLVTWYETDSVFSAHGKEPSARSLGLQPGTRLEVTEHATGCAACD